MEQKKGEKQEIPEKYRDMTTEDALEAVFEVMLSRYGKTTFKIGTSRQSTKEVWRGVAGLNEDQAKKQLREMIQILLDMFDITEMTLDHANFAKLIYKAHKRESGTIALKKESSESYLVFHQGHMITLRHTDTVEHLYASIFSKGKRIND